MAQEVSSMTDETNKPEERIRPPGVCPSAFARGAKAKPKRTMAHSLKTVMHVGIEMARVYRATKRKEIGTADGYRMIMCLAALRQTLESAEFERRLAEMEAAINKPSDVVKFLPKVVP
jgi:hypothetical protein